MLSRSFLRSSLALWRRRHAYRQRHLDIAHARNDARAIARWEKRRRDAAREIRKRLRQLAKGNVAPPVAVKDVVTSRWGWHPGVHDGIDIICDEGDNLYAICDGEIIDVRKDGWWRMGAPRDASVRSRGDGIIQLRCATDAGPFSVGLHFGYGHAENPQVRVGQKVKAGQLIGKAGLAVVGHTHFMCNGGQTMKGIGDRDPRPHLDYAAGH